jgi:hypothetical protein
LKSRLSVFGAVTLALALFASPQLASGAAGHVRAWSSRHVAMHESHRRHTRSRHHRKRHGGVKPSQPPKPARPSGVVDLPVSFKVENVNRSKVPCLSYGREYTVRGHLVAPGSTLTSAAPRAVTIYLHGTTVGEPTWRFKAVAGYDYAYEQARAGHASVTIDQLGYGASDIPNGNQICTGSQADIVHQIVGKLRSGD